ncbi:MAG: MarR family transcriptional regulator [Clostridia bacterium]|nr:MarR family transcriptional regulator [Clostridia bacterium]
MKETRYDRLKLSRQLCFPLYAASREVIRQYRPYLDALDLTYTQYITMMVLWEHERQSVKDLGAQLFLDSGTLTPVLKSLEAKGYVRRTRGEQDERLLIVDLTEEGRALRDKAASVPQQMASCIRLSREEAATLYKLLYKLLRTENDL